MDILKRLANPRLSRSYGRFVAGLLLLFALVTQTPWLHQLWGKFAGFPELRHDVSVIKHTDPERADLVSAHVLVVNAGQGAAENVLISMSAPQADFLEYQVQSQELYKIESEDLSAGVLKIWLDRLTSGAAIGIKLTGTMLTTDTLTLSAASDQGVSMPIVEQTMATQFSNLTDEVAQVFDETGKVLEETQAVRGAADWISDDSYLSQFLETVKSEAFRKVGLTFLVLAALILIFLPESCSGCAIPLLVGLIIWLFFDFPIPKPWAVGLVTIVVLAVLWGSTLVDDDLVSFGCVAMIVVIVAALVCAWWFWHSTVTARWVVAPAAVLAFWFAVAYGTPTPQSPTKKED